MSSRDRRRWRPSRSKRPARPAAACLVALVGLVVSACWDVGEPAQRLGQDALEPEAAGKSVAPDDERAAHGAEHDPRSGELSRSPGYAEGATATGAAPDVRVPQEAGARAPDTSALAALDYQAAQSLNQRTNEALDYLGDPSLGKSAELEIAKSRPAPGPQPGRLATPDVFRDRGDALQPETQTPSPAQRFALERRASENLRFQRASGYWANTYVPGDPVMRWLESRLEERDRGALEAFSGRPLLLEAAARQTPQPFDPPRSAAVSVFLQADRRGLESEGRMLVQVGIQGARRHGRLRPAMRVGIVLDLRGTIGAETASAMRALVDGFLEAKDMGDRFSLTVAGRPGGVRVAADEFRHGPILLAMRDLMEPAALGAARGPHLALDEAVRKTAADLRRSADPGAPLGSSLVVLVTSQPLAPFTGALTALAHESAVAGVPVSVVGIGERLQLEELDRVALAGQGNRRLLHAPAEAERLVARELSSLARVIARALRLRIRLAPDVKLVEVIGAERLDRAGAQRVREAESSIDRRLARNLGIQADRGEDEEGIQIVIPTFYSGDAHAVLLDVVAPGPGPIADVTLRYKDLVYLRNSVARANLSLGRNADPPGPLERNVLKNYLAIRLSEVLRQAGRTLLAGGDDQTLALVRDFHALLVSLQREVPGFQNDADLANDVGLLGEYLALLETGVLQHDEPRRHLADSLQLSGYFKTVPRSRADPRDPRR